MGRFLLTKKKKIADSSKHVRKLRVRKGSQPKKKVGGGIKKKMHPNEGWWRTPKPASAIGVDERKRVGTNGGMKWGNLENCGTGKVD